MCRAAEHQLSSASFGWPSPSNVPGLVGQNKTPPSSTGSFIELLVTNLAQSCWYTTPAYAPRLTRQAAVAVLQGPCHDAVCSAVNSPSAPSLLDSSVSLLAGAAAAGVATTVAMVSIPAWPSILKHHKGSAATTRQGCRAAATARDPSAVRENTIFRCVREHKQPARTSPGTS